ncbi:MAG: DUF4331 domain-containing protein [Planctomycetes bacterium]|nr:DUF4331 domain-containing protein [Planctomycetota bacterium]
MHMLTVRHGAAGAGGFALLAALALPAPSSHREAPFVTETPKVDATDFYLFNSYEPGRDGYVTLIANYLPLQAAYGGPNYFALDPNALYEIHVDNDGDAQEDLTFSFRFTNNLKDLALAVGNPGQEKSISIPLINAAPIDATNTGGLNVGETYTLNVIEGNRRTGKATPVVNAKSGATTFERPVDNIGTKSIPDYAGYAAARTYDIQLPDGSLGRMFVGQRDDPFVVNLGEAFDLVNLDPLGAVDGAEDVIADANVTSLILELPARYLTGGNGSVIGGWTTASLRQEGKLKDKPTFAEPEGRKGKWMQVSRLSSPLVNELVIGLKDKDKFNASEPKDDAQFLDYVTHPALPELLEALFGVRAPNLFPRSDLVSVFVTGVAGLNANGGVGEMLRLNTAIAATPKALQSNLGVIGGDLAGYPNGRRLGDDVVDISLRAVMGVLLNATDAPDGQLPYTDGAYVDATQFGDAFPYVNLPFPGAPKS